MKHSLAIAMALISAAGLHAAADLPVPEKFTALEQPVRNTRPIFAQPSSSAFITKKASPMRVPNDGREYTTVLEEDFSLMTAGSENDPDPTVINDEYFMIPSRYTHTPGWAGRGVMQAGGAVCLGYWIDSWTGAKYTGQIETPELDLHRDQGKAYLSFRAKLLAPDQFDMVCVRWVAETDMLPMTSDVQTMAVNGFQWTTYEVELTDCPSNAVIQIYADNLELLVDDIKVEQFHINTSDHMCSTDSFGAFPENVSAISMINANPETACSYSDITPHEESPIQRAKITIIIL